MDDEQVTKGVYGGYVKLSEEDSDWTAPEVLGLLLDDMARVYANETDSVACANLVSGASQTQDFENTQYGDPEVWVAWMYNAAQKVLENSNGNLPSHLFLAPNMWRQIGLLSDDSGRPLFPQVGPMNAFGSMSPASTAATAFGLTVVVDRHFEEDVVIIGDPTGYELFEQQKGALAVEATDGSLSRIIKFRGYFATLMIDAEKFTKVNWI